MNWQKTIAAGKDFVSKEGLDRSLAKIAEPLFVEVVSIIETASTAMNGRLSVETGRVLRFRISNGS